MTSPSSPRLLAQRPADRLLENQSFGKYRVIRALGAGGMAQVFLASLDGPDGFSKTCVIKRIRPEFAGDETYAQMFANEAKVAAVLSHPNIVQVFEFAEDQGTQFLAMEYVEGASLEQLVRAARAVDLPLGPRVAVDIGLSIGTALSYVHDFALPGGESLDLVHRDVTPGNVLVSRDGAVKLADFGVAQSAKNHHHTVAGVVKGKISYMSPEQISGMPVDRRSDLFSLGIILYELTTGRRLFYSDSVGATALAVVRGRIPPPSELVPNVPAQLEQIIMRALARDLRKRYPTAAELVADLEMFRVSRSWTSGGASFLGGIVTALFAKAPVSPGSSSGLSRSVLSGALSRSALIDRGMTEPPVDIDFGIEGVEEESCPLDVEEEVSLDARELEIIEEGPPAPNEEIPPYEEIPPKEEISPYAVAFTLALTLLGSAVFWYIVV